MKTPIPNFPKVVEIITDKRGGFGFRPNDRARLQVANIWFHKSPDERINCRAGFNPLVSRANMLNRHNARAMLEGRVYPWRETSVFGFPFRVRKW